MGKGTGKGGSAFDLFFGSFYCMFIILFIGPCCLFVGLGFVGMAMDDQRGKDIHLYNMRVEEWKGSLSSSDNLFKHANFSVALEHTCAGSEFLNETVLRGGEKPRDELKDGSDDNALPLAPQYKYFALSNVDVPKAKDCKVTFTFKSHYLGEDGESLEQLAKVTETLVKETNSYCSRSSGLSECNRLCASRGGELKLVREGMPTCVIRSALTSVCVKVAYNKESNKWVLDNAKPKTGSRKDTHGCFYRPKDNGYLSENSRRLFQTPKYKAFSEKQADSAGKSQIEVLVRSSEDPWLHYMRITNGDGKFGMSTEVKLIVGFSFLCIGALLTILELKAFYFFCYYKRNPQVRRPRNTMLALYYDAAHKRTMTTGVPVSMLPPERQYMQQHQHTTVNPYATSQGQSQSTHSSQHAVVGTPLYINL